VEIRVTLRNDDQVETKTNKEKGAIEAASGRVFVLDERHLAPSALHQLVPAECYDSNSNIATKATKVIIKTFSKAMEDKIKHNGESEWTAAEKARLHLELAQKLHIAYDIFPYDKSIYLVYEVKDSLTFADFVKAQGPLNEVESNRLIKFLLTTLNDLHRAYLSPLQVSPSYVLIEDGQYKLSGICHRHDRGAVLGDPRFAAPELRNRSRQELLNFTMDEGERADIWSIGMVLLFALTGRHYLPDDVVNGGVDRILGDSVISEGAKDFLKLLLHHTPHHRPTVHDAMHHHWLTSDE